MEKKLHCPKCGVLEELKDNCCPQCGLNLQVSPRTACFLTLLLLIVVGAGFYAAGYLYWGIYVVGPRPPSQAEQHQARVSEAYAAGRAEGRQLVDDYVKAHGRHSYNDSAIQGILNTAVLGVERRTTGDRSREIVSAFELGANAGKDERIRELMKTTR